MKIISWNCGGAFRNKYQLLNKFDADILVIQECENPELSKDNTYASWAENYLWIGSNKNKGLGIFARTNIKINKINLDDQNLKYFIPCNINGEFNLLASWCHGANSPTFGYIGQFWKYMQLHKNNFSKIIIAGDFNSNTIWDKWDRWWNHSDVVRELAELEIHSFYHSYNKEKTGKETQPTFFHRKNTSKSYHIDYFFGSQSIINNLKSFEICKVEDWLDFSDHVPVIAEITS